MYPKVQKQNIEGSLVSHLKNSFCFVFTDKLAGTTMPSQSSLHC